jgi:hypothetical protein
MNQARTSEVSEGLPISLGKLDTVAVVVGGEVLKIISRRADPELASTANPQGGAKGHASAHHQ